jgi:hypothetical protein
MKVTRTLFLVLLLLSFIIINTEALDYPHSEINNISCESCHFVYGDEPSLLPPWTAHLNKWTYVVATYDGENNRVGLYINGVLDREYTGTDVPASLSYSTYNTPAFTIGKRIYDWRHSGYFRGKIDELFLYNRAFTDSEVADRYISWIN